MTARRKARSYLEDATNRAALLVFGLRSVTRTVEAAVLGAGPARARDLLPERLAGAEHPHAGVTRRDPGRRGVVLHWKTFDLDLAEDVRVLGLQRVCEPRDATARDAGELLAAVRGRLELRGELHQPPVLDGLPALVVDDGIVEDPVEPARHGITHLVHSVQA